MARDMGHRCWGMPNSRSGTAAGDGTNGPAVAALRQPGCAGAGRQRSGDAGGYGAGGAFACLRVLPCWWSLCIRRWILRFPISSQDLCESSVCARPAEAAAAFALTGSMRFTFFDCLHCRLRARSLGAWEPTSLSGPGRYRIVHPPAHRCVVPDEWRHRQADAAEADAQRHGVAGRPRFPMVNRVYVCSGTIAAALKRCPADRGRAAKCGACARASDAARSGIFRFLFLGTLGYYPNHDAVLWFCSAILPLVTPSLPHPFEVGVAGRGASERLSAP